MVVVSVAGKFQVPQGWSQASPFPLGRLYHPKELSSSPASQNVAAVLTISLIEPLSLVAVRTMNTPGIGEAKTYSLL
jgi:hypothetical protein